MRNLFLGFVAVAAVGCGNVGGSPEGASAGEMKSTFDKLPIDDRAKMLIQSPGPLDEQKKSRVRDLYQKEGKTMPPEIEKMMAGSGTGH